MKDNFILNYILLINFIILKINDKILNILNYTNN